MTFQIRKAERKQAKLRIGVFGPSGSGKTMSSLRLAYGLVHDWSKITIIDTENGSADLYDHLGAYNVLTLTAPYTPERYIEAIKACEQAGSEAIIIDSITHEWAGPGGVLEIADIAAKDAKNSFAVWKKLTPRHNKFIDSILQSPCHVICCGRSKQDYALNQVEKNGRTVNVPEKIGLKAITRDGFDYEMTVSFDLSITHLALCSKDRTGLFMDKPEAMITEEYGKTLRTWNEKAPMNETEVKRLIMVELVRLGFGREQITVDLIKQVTGLVPSAENNQTIFEMLKTARPEDVVMYQEQKKDDSDKNDLNGLGGGSGEKKPQKPTEAPNTPTEPQSVINSPTPEQSPATKAEQVAEAFGGEVVEPATAPKQERISRGRQLMQEALEKSKAKTNNK